MGKKQAPKSPTTSDRVAKIAGKQLGDPSTPKKDRPPIASALDQHKKGGGGGKKGGGGGKKGEKWSAYPRHPSDGARRNRHLAVPLEFPLVLVADMGRDNLGILAVVDEPAYRPAFRRRHGRLIYMPSGYVAGIEPLDQHEGVGLTVGVVGVESQASLAFRPTSIRRHLQSPRWEVSEDPNRYFDAKPRLDAKPLTVNPPWC
jgi:hypothetical protein